MSEALPRARTSSGVHVPAGVTTHDRPSTRRAAAAQPAVLKRAATGPRCPATVAASTKIAPRATASTLLVDDQQGRAWLVVRLGATAPGNELPATVTAQESTMTAPYMGREIWTGWWLPRTSRPTTSLKTIVDW